MCLTLKKEGNLSAIGESFVRGLHYPIQQHKNGLFFQKPLANELWQIVYKEIGAGWFANGFYHLFSKDLEQLNPCLTAWAHLFPPQKMNRQVIGRNAHGSLLILENSELCRLGGSIAILDTLTTSYWRNPKLNFFKLLSSALPNKKLPNFFQHQQVFDQYRQFLLNNNNASNLPLSINQMLAIKTPLQHGGQMELDNFEVQDIFTYYQQKSHIHKKRKRRNLLTLNIG